MANVSRNEIVRFLDGWLPPGAVQDVAINGLQFPGGDEIAKVALAVDATLHTIEQAVAAGADLLFVHHGIFWTYQSSGPVDDIRKRYYQLLLDGQLSLYASHLPLDVHPLDGNNARLLTALTARELSQKGGGADDNPVDSGAFVPFCEYKGVAIGLYTDLAAEVSLSGFAGRLLGKVGPEGRLWTADGVGPFTIDSLVPVGPGGVGEKPVGRLAVITGAGQEGLEFAQALDINTFITGEVAHYSVARARELGVNLITAGHYATETFGVQSVGKRLAAQFGIETVFIDAPSGL